MTTMTENRITEAATLMADLSGMTQYTAAFADQLQRILDFGLTPDEQEMAARLAREMVETGARSLRTLDIRLRVTPAEKARIQERADAEGQTVSTYIRRRLDLNS